MLLEKEPKRNLKIHFSLHVNHQMMHRLIMNSNGCLSLKVEEFEFFLSCMKQLISFNFISVLF